MCFESLAVFFSDESSGFGPVFEEQPVDTIYPEESPEDKIIMNCRTRANPPATYRSHTHTYTYTYTHTHRFTFVKSGDSP
uniref:Uncharacterized protein n=1 Tax=Sinocyclocheilus grahami TaxID=75366 RepID=A0A672M8W8_SINGR